MLLKSAFTRSLRWRMNRTIGGGRGKNENFPIQRASTELLYAFKQTAIKRKG